MKYCILIILILLCFTGICSAQGYLDYEQHIDDQYLIVRTNAEEIVICNTNHNVVFFPSDYGSGRILKYAVTKDYIFTQNKGNNNPDYFILNKHTDKITGPLSLLAFQRNEISSHYVDTLQWKSPKNPHIIIALVTGLVIISYGYLIKYWFILLLFIVPIIILLIKKHKTVT